MTDLENWTFWEKPTITDPAAETILFSSLLKEYKRVVENEKTIEKDLAAVLTANDYKGLLEDHIKKEVIYKIKTLDLSSLSMDALLKIGEQLDTINNINQEQSDGKIVLSDEIQLNTSLRLLGLSTRSYNFLYAADFHTLWDIYKVYTAIWRDRFRKRIRNFGERSLEEVENMLIERWLIKREDIKETGE